MNSGYIIGYKRDANGVEYRYLADANGNIVTTENAKATADLGAGEQELDTATVVPENTPVTVTANIPERRVPRLERRACRRQRAESGR